MIPNDPINEPLQPAALPPPVAPPANPFWDYKDLLVFVFLLIPSLALAMLAIGLLTFFTALNAPLKLFLLQIVFYFLILGSLGAIFRLRYHEPLWRSLGWKSLPVLSAAACLFAGPFLALGLAILGAILRTPEIPLPFQQMLANRSTVVLFGILVVLLGPLCEELVFRGFMMPLFIRTLGAALGILFTAVLFGCAHGYEYAWSWRHILLISTAGLIFGWARYKTGSTAAAAFMHSTFNLTQFAAFVAQSAHSSTGLPF